MINKLIVKCRRILYSEKIFFPKETVFHMNGFIMAEIVDWYRDNMLFYEKRDSWERKSIPFVSEEIFRMFFVARIISSLEGNSTAPITIEINSECVYLSGGDVEIRYPDVFESVLYKKIWKKNGFDFINFSEVYKEEKSKRRVSIINNSVYLNFKSKARNKKYFQKNGHKYSEKELVIKDALELFSTSFEISKYTNIPHRTVRYYLNKMVSYGVVIADGNLNSPSRTYKLVNDYTK